MSSIDRIVNERFLNALAGSARAGSTQFQRSSSDNQDTVGIALQTGLRAYVAAVQGLNTAASFITIARADLGKLGKITDELKELAQRGTQSGTGTQGRQEIDARIQKLGKQFERIVEGAEFQGQNYLTKGGLGDLLRTFGLDESTSKTIDAAFDRFVMAKGNDDLASEKVEGDKSVLVPEEAYTTPVPIARSSRKVGDMFDSERRIRNRPEAYQFLSQVVALEKQIDRNVKALDNLQGVVLENLKLVRAAGFAFLEQSDEQIRSPQSAEAVARELRIKIRQNAGAAIAQAENLEPITVASLLLSQSDSNKSK